ncbi:hypothetical protein QTP88_012608 [Uroleucon formosanum]
MREQIKIRRGGVPAEFAWSYRPSRDSWDKRGVCESAAEKAFRDGGVRRTRRVSDTKECAALATRARLQRRRRGFAGCWTGARAWIDACAFPAIPTGWVRENNHAAAPTARELSPYTDNSNSYSKSRSSSSSSSSRGGAGGCGCGGVVVIEVVVYSSGNMIVVAVEMVLAQVVEIVYRFF